VVNAAENREVASEIGKFSGEMLKKASKERMSYTAVAAVFWIRVLKESEPLK